jgi:hypothetical protein
MTALTNSGAALWLPKVVETNVSRYTDLRIAALAQRPTTTDEQVKRAELLARVYERESRWWWVLASWADHTGPDAALVGLAAHCAVESCARESRFWSGLAEDIAAVAAGQDICPVIGCGCGGVCGVAS